jgi:hypothetical protein
MGSRAQALGGAFTAMDGSPNSLYYNPAGMAFYPERELMLYHASWFSDISIENATVTYPLNRAVALGAGISFLRMPDLTRYEIDATGGPLAMGTFSAYDLAMTAGISTRLSDNFSLGANIKYFQESLETVRAGGFAVDLGAQIRLVDSALRLGIAAQNLGPAVRYQEQRADLPRTFRAGLAYRHGYPGYSLALDVVQVLGQPLQVRPGLEYHFSKQLALRSGYQTTAGSGSGINAGFGIRLIDEHTINYAYTPYGDLGDAHRAEMVFHLGSVDGALQASEARALQRESDREARQSSIALKPLRPPIPETTLGSMFARVAPPHPRRSRCRFWKTGATGLPGRVSPCRMFLTISMPGRLTGNAGYG